MRVLAQLSALVGALLVIVAVIGRFLREPTVTIFPGQSHAASSVILLAIAVFLFGILAALLQERK